MEIENTNFSDLKIINLKHFNDERGFFTRFHCSEVFRQLGLPENFPQTNFSNTLKKGSIRGMHFQINGHEECKIISCISGSIFDVVIDLRKESKTYLKTYSILLNEKDNKRFVVPEGFAHGFQSLSDNTSVIYQVTNSYSPGNEKGIRFDDPYFNIEWPLPVSVISDKDLNLPNFNPV